MTKKKKSILISVISVAVVLAIVLPIVIINVVKKNKRLDWNGYMISGFSDFSAMGAAVIDTDGASSVAYAVDEVSPIGDKKDNHDAHLVGFKNDGSFEKIKFKDEDGKLHSQDAKLIHFDTYKKFSVASFSSDKDLNYVDIGKYGYEFWRSDDPKRPLQFILDSVYPHDFCENGDRTYGYDDSAFFIIDNETGKIYDIEHIIEKIKDAIYKDVGEVPLFINTINLNNIYNPIEYDYILMGVEFYADNKSNYYLFEISFKDNNIEVTQRMNKTQFNNFSFGNRGYESLIYEYLYCDKYGNIVWMDDSLSHYNYQKTDGTFGQIDKNGTLKLSPNGIFYYQNAELQYLNKYGVLESITNTEIKVLDVFNNIGNSEVNYKYLYQKENIIYLAYSNPNVPKHALMKMILSKENDWDYSLEFVDFNDGKTPSYRADGTSVAANGGYLYELTNGVLMKYNIETGEHQEYESKYQFKDLKYNKKLSQVTFMAVDKTTMTEVEGYFDENNEIVIGDFKDVNRGLNRVYVVKPIN